MDQPVENGLLARWDTTTITDGEYQLKLVLNKNDGTSENVLVAPIYVRNYSIEPTSAVVPTSDGATGNTELTPTINGLIYATPLPKNPASTSESGIMQNIIISIIFSVLILAGLLFYRFISGRKRMR